MTIFFLHKCCGAGAAHSWALYRLVPDFWVGYVSSSYFLTWTSFHKDDNLQCDFLQTIMKLSRPLTNTIKLLNYTQYDNERIERRRKGENIVIMWRGEERWEKEGGITKKRGRGRESAVKEIDIAEEEDEGTQKDTHGRYIINYKSTV